MEQEMGEMTFVVKFEDGKEPRVGFRDEILGGMITAIACYDAIHTGDIAEEAIDECGCEKCKKASREISNIISATMVKRLPEGSVSENKSVPHHPV